METPNDSDSSDFALDLEELSSAEDFLTYFNVPFDAKVVHVNRLHIMQRYHDYLAQSETALADYEGNDAAIAAVYKRLLTQAYEDFVTSDASTEKVLKVYKMQGPQTDFVSLDSLFGQ
jgi:nitrogenase-stabilizing/protective protein